MRQVTDSARTHRQQADPLRSGQRSGPLSDLVSMRIVVLFGLLRRSQARTLRQLFGLSETEWRIVTQLGPFAPLSLNGLAELLTLDRGQLSRAVKGMVERGLVTRVNKPGGPEIELALSGEGEKLFEQLVERAFERDSALTADIDQDDLCTAKRVLEQMIVHAEKLI